MLLYIYKGKYKAKYICDIVSILHLSYALKIIARVENRRTNLGKIYFENKYIINIISENAKITSFIKKKGISCGKKKR